MPFDLFAVPKKCIKANGLMDNQGRVPLGEGEEKYFAIELKLQKC